MLSEVRRRSRRGKRPGVRLRQAVTFLAGAVALVLLVDRGPLDFLWTPLVLGATYLVAAVLGGRDGGHWSTACVLLGWGASVVLLSETTLDVATAPGYLAGAGLGALAAGALERAGYPTDLVGVAATIILAGLAFSFSDRWAGLLQAETYAAALAAVGAVNLALTLRR